MGVSGSRTQGLGFQDLGFRVSSFMVWAQGFKQHLLKPKAPNRKFLKVEVYYLSALGQPQTQTPNSEPCGRPNAGLGSQESLD